MTTSSGWPSDVAIYRGTYSDALGREILEILNDGEVLRAVIRGVAFSGRDLDSLEPSSVPAADVQKSFALDCGSLCGCQLEIEIPLTVVREWSEIAACLRVHVRLPPPTERDHANGFRLQTTLVYESREIAASGTTGWFEGELLEIQRQMPAGEFVKACINCLYSDYSPYGHGCFGWMMCFRNLKAEYLRVRSKETLWPIHDRFERLVYETYLCPEFELRRPGTGYRG